MAEWVKNNIPKLKRFLPVLAGAGIGYLYWYFIGCNTGSCAITSNPWSSVLYGALFGAIFITKPKQKAVENENA
jgi:xanthine/uracil permease